MTAERTIDPSLPQEEIVTRLIELLSTDATQPPAWRSDEALRQLEQDIMRRDAEGLRAFAVICGQVWEGLARGGFGRTLALLQLINARRRMRPCDLAEVRRLIGLAEKEIPELGEGPWQNRLEELLAYHTGIFARDQGQYDLAAQAQEWAARTAEAAGNTAGALISRFCVQVERMNAALVEGSPKGMLAAFLALCERGEDILAASIPLTTDWARWCDANVPIHMLVASFLSDIADHESELHTGIVLDVGELEEPWAKEFAGWIAVVRAMDHLNHLRLYEAGLAAQAVIQTEKQPEVVAMAHLVLAQTCLRQGNLSGALRAWQAVLAMPSAGIHAMQAVARRELEKYRADPA